MSIRAEEKIRDRTVRMMIDRWIAEATEYDFKVALEVKKPKSWLKSVSAFANGIGGTLFFGIDNDRNVIGLSDAQTDAETISRLIKERITPYPSFVLAPERENGKDILVLSVSSGRSTPYYYKADGIMEAYIRMGNESVIAPSYALNQLILKGMHRTYDELISEYDFKDYAFSKLRERYKAWTGNSMEEKLFDSFDMRDENGKLQRRNLEIDFVVNRHDERLYIQSAYALSDKEKVDQEQASLLNVNDGFRKLIIVGDRYRSGYNEEGILMMSLSDFLLGKGGWE